MSSSLIKPLRRKASKVNACEPARAAIIARNSSVWAAMPFPHSAGGDWTVCKAKLGRMPLFLNTPADLFKLTVLSGVQRTASRLEIIAKLATVLEVEPAELIRLPARQPPPNI